MPVGRGAFMPDKSSDLVQGTLDMLVLKTLALEPMHGYGISVRIEQMSKGVFRPNAGSLFLAIQRLERQANRWRMEANGKQQASEVLRSDAEGTKETQ
jgi:PadR family transcriptional regulator